MKSKNINQLVAAGALCGIGIVVPMLMPKIVIGPMSFTLASHVAIFMAMFISPKLAAAVCLGTTLGFFMTTPVIIALRAASHIVFFAVLGALLIKKMPEIIEKPLAGTMFNGGMALVHAAAEVAVVSPFFLAGSIFKPEHLADGYVMSVLVLVGVGTFLHSLIDYTISIMLWKPVRAALPSLAELRE
ncbi:MAG: hypothetical protein LUH17_08285 [Acidaminococcaceae bacterium]|nr:hypothetical protein [Acidaminococcaceae bacterium]